MNSIATILIATAVLGAPTFTQDFPRSPEPGPGAHRPSRRQRAHPSAAQLPRTPQPRPGSTGRGARARRCHRPRQPAPPPPGERRAAPTRNVKIDVTITDQTGSAAPMKKVVSLILADGRPGGVRSMTSVPLVWGGPNRELPLNVDATAMVTPEQKVLLDLKFNYAQRQRHATRRRGRGPTPVTEEEKARDRDMAAPRPAFGNITENLAVLLTQNVPFVVARSADAATDRTVTVEVKAEILK